MFPFSQTIYTYSIFPLLMKQIPQTEISSDLVQDIPKKYWQNSLTSIFLNSWRFLSFSFMILEINQVELSVVFYTLT